MSTIYVRFDTEPRLERVEERLHKPPLGIRCTEALRSVIKIRKQVVHSTFDTNARKRGLDPEPGECKSTGVLEEGNNT